MTSHQDNGVQDVQDGGCYSASPRVFFFFFLSNRTKKQKRRVREREIKASYILQDCFFLSFFSSFLICDAKELKHGAELLSLARSTREKENRRELNNESNTLRSLIHFLYFTLNIERPSSQPAAPFSQTEKWKLWRIGCMKDGGSLHPLFVSFPGTLTDVVLQFYTRLAC